MFKDKIYV